MYHVDSVACGKKSCVGFQKLCSAVVSSYCFHTAEVVGVLQYTHGISLDLSWGVGIWSWSLEY